ncbi:hypothetical protein SEA_TAQUITO_50 [Mycobacterium phage Taquito]|uniref:Uncharacterized protein n=1 Tax=Mycobacterium phage Taquito TaxID=1897500 RepID=A0A1D8EQ57_9CAUD|nr:hypothetical protein I5G70_gp83 [Mycobacterium phage Taquito]AOT23170.1 hypothetical protein SEA_TAQUITO_50 [Mycobacterium phage Taquito]
MPGGDELASLRLQLEEANRALHAAQADARKFRDERDDAVAERNRVLDERDRLIAELVYLRDCRDAAIAALNNQALIAWWKENRPPL